MEKIRMTTPLVEMDGDEMTRILWKMIKDELITPFVDLKTEYYDLGLPERERNAQPPAFFGQSGLVNHGSPPGALRRIFIVLSLSFFVCPPKNTPAGVRGTHPFRRLFQRPSCRSARLSTASSAGETPGMRDACPRETGRWTVSFWRASRRSASMCI